MPGMLKLSRFNRRMAYACASLLTISIVGCRLTAIHTDVTSRVIAVAAVLGLILWIPAFWHNKGQVEFRDSALTLPWAALIAALLQFPLLIAARLRMPLQDNLFARIDESLGVRVPDIVAWSTHHWLGALLNHSYGVLVWMLVASIFVPALSGKTKDAQAFIDANLVAFAISVPLFAVFPAIGPWSHYHFAASPSQIDCQNHLLELRMTALYTLRSQGVGIVSFPSFHVIWAILSARALWGFRFLRIPVSVLSLMIILSTLTTGWHYLSDLLAGIIVAIVSTYVVRARNSGTFERRNLSPMTQSNLTSQPMAAARCSRSPKGPRFS